mgnify:CR=1 FL=1
MGLVALVNWPLGSLGEWIGDQGVFSGILQNADWLDQFGHPSDTKTGIIVSCYNLGCLTGCIGETNDPAQ